MATSLSKLRNFAIISHIDHGKTTLTDRLFELGHTGAHFKKVERLLDSNPIEKERGITIKLAPVRLRYTAPESQETYTLNLIDTPGHVDFSYEVSRSLAACEGAVLLVDVTQGIQAQTLATATLAQEHNLVLVPVVNKIDIREADPRPVRQELVDAFGFKDEEIINISAKTGENVQVLLKMLIKMVPPPAGDIQKPLRALVFNSHYHPHRGVIVAVKLFDGDVRAGQWVKLLRMGASFKVQEVGIFSPELEPVDCLGPGEVGYVATGLKDITLAQAGDTLTLEATPTATPLPGYKSPQPVVFVDIYPHDSREFLKVKVAVEKLKLNDAALQWQTVSTPSLGQGIRLGCLGLLHAEIIQERLEREFMLDVVTATPSVTHHLTLSDGTTMTIRSASELPDPSRIRLIEEPYLETTILTPIDYLPEVLRLTQTHHGELTDQTSIGTRAKIILNLPLRELLRGFADKLKSVSSGYASLDYTLKEYRPSDIVRVDIVVNGEVIPPLATLVLRDEAPTIGRRLVEKLKAVLPREQFAVPIQATVGGTIIARETLKSFRKDVTAKLYGGDQTRKDKLLKKQKRGKKRLKRFGTVSISPKAMLEVLRS